MSRWLISLIGGMLLLAMVWPAQAAPMRRLRYTIEGTIESVTWHPKQWVVPGKPVFYCSPTKPYYKPAYYIVVLKDTVSQRGPHPWERPGSLPATSHGKQWTLQLNHPSDDLGLKPEMRIRVIGYTIGGDECGRWYGYDRLQILDSAAENATGAADHERGSSGEDHRE